MCSLPCPATVAMCASGSRISTSPSASMSRALTSGLVHADVERLRVVDVQLDRDLLQVEDDVRCILDHARDWGELVEHAVDLHCGDGRAFNRREQNATERVADRRPEAALEGLRVKPPEAVGERLALELEALRPLKILPEHLRILSPTGRQPGLQTCVLWSLASRRRSEGLRAGDLAAIAAQSNSEFGTRNSELANAECGVRSAELVWK